ncbi:p-hydroxybenzoic acid efflux pump subunit AaeB [Serratia fonticola]|uniref:p-hydroxybenzoic acid efflux pump subunit AaeB n=1 Tax=Serratia fonticola TaxID=47917 RepID=A0A4U9W9S1_SERFO|nr:p-hydroxybenzoic acid efflux pump subunit AaeB [Serratia fonticola]
MHTNSGINAVENEILAGEVVVKRPSAEGHHAMINGLRAWAATSIGCLFWLWTGWTSGSGCMVMIAVVTALAMRTPNPKMMALDFLLGVLVALPLGALFYMFILPETQQKHVLAVPEPGYHVLCHRDRSAETPFGIARHPGEYY